MVAVVLFDVECVALCKESSEADINIPLSFLVSELGGWFIQVIVFSKTSRRPLPKTEEKESEKGI